MKESQRAIVAARLANMKQGRGTDKLSLNSDEVSLENAAELLNVSRAQVAEANQKTIYEKPHTETKKGALGGGKKGKGTRRKTESDTVSFTADTAKKAKTSRRSIEQGREVVLDALVDALRVRWNSQ